MIQIQHSFEDLSREKQQHYLTMCRAMLDRVRTFAVPIIVAPPQQADGEIHGGTGFVFQHGSGTHHLVSAHHVLKDGYQKRAEQGEDVHWLVGRLPPFNPFSRFHSIDHDRDIVRWPISAEEAAKACLPWSRIIIAPTEWPPSPPRIGQPLLMAGFPGKLREIRPGDRISVGGASAIFRVEFVGLGYCKCRIDRSINYGSSAAMPENNGDTNGWSGGPVFKLEDSGNLSLAGIILQSSDGTEGLDLIRIATLDDMTIRSNEGMRRVAG
jgi:hypothetical protein